MPMTIEARREVVRLAGLDVEEFGDADSLEALRRAERRLDEAIQAAEAAGEYRRIEPDAIAELLSPGAIKAGV